MTFRRVSVGAEKFITITRFDRTEIEALRRESNGAARSKADSASVERQRLTRELHDSTSQLLVGTNLLLGSLKRNVAGPNAILLINELEELVREIQQEIRSAAYLARPPALETLSFTDALQELIEGFGARSGITTTLFVSENGNIPPGPAENSLYRIVQEALSNILRHARATEACVSMVARKGMTHLVIRDNGRGIRPSAARGVGLAGMQARMAELKGRLTIRALSPGTAIVASLRGIAS